MASAPDRTVFRMLAKTAWLAALIGTACLATLGMGTGFLSFDPTETLETDRSAERLLTASGFLFLGLALLAWRVFRAPGWSLLILVGIASGCMLLTNTDLRFVAVLLLWPLAMVAASGVLWQPKPSVERFGRGE